MTTLPELLYFKGNTYHLYEEECDGDYKGWWTFRYAENPNSIPPHVTDGKEGYYLVVMDISREKAYNDLLERINNMKSWV